YFGFGIESDRPEKHGFLVIAEQVDRKVSGQLNAAARVGAIADNVPEAVDLIDTLPLDVPENALESGEISVDIRNDGALHKRLNSSESLKTGPFLLSGLRCLE